MKTTKEMIEVMQAFENGAEIEAKPIVVGDWEEETEPEWDWVSFDYRIKKQPKEPEYIPFSFEDAEQLIGKVVKSKDENWIEMITWCDNDEASSISYSNLLYGYTFIEGSPCGKLKQ